MRIPWKRRTLLPLSAISAFALIFLFVVPVVPFSASIAIPYNYEPGWDACHLIKATNATLEAKYQQCLEDHLYPAAQMSGSSTISYSLLGLGPPPYPREKLVTQGNTSVLVYFKGASIEAAEYIGIFPNASLNPPGMVKIENESLRLDTNDLLAFSAVVVNTGPNPMTLIVRTAGSGLFGSNSTKQRSHVDGRRPSRVLLCSDPRTQLPVHRISRGS
jgi:hypothetical protein